MISEQHQYSLSTIVNHSSVGIIYQDKEGLVTYYNDTAKKLLAAVTNLELGTPLSNLEEELYKEGEEPIDYPANSVLKNGIPFHNKIICIKLTNSLIKWININCDPYFADNTGELVGVISTITDITEIKDSKEKLVDNEETYHQMVDAVKDYAIILLDIDGTVTNWNKGAEKICGYKKEEIIGKNFSVFYTKEDLLTNVPKRVLEEAKIFGKALTESWRVKKDGTNFWASASITTLKNKEGELIGFTKITKDITERKNSQDRLLAYERRFHTALNTLGDSIWEHDFATEKTWFAETIENVLGFKPSEIINNSEFWRQQIFPEDRWLIDDTDKKYRDNSIDSHALEYRIFHKNGNLIWVLDRGKVYERDEYNKPLKIIGSHKDITKRKLEQDAIKDAKEQMQLFIENTPAAVAMFDEEMNYIIASKKWYEEYGLEEKEVLGKSHYSFVYETQNLASLIECQQSCLKGNIEKREKELFVKKDGSQQWIQYEMQPWIRKNGMVGGLTIFTEFITERIINEEKLSKTNEKLINSNKALEQFAYVASHDLQEPLRMVSSFLKLLEKKYKSSLDETAHEYINFAVNGADRMKTLISDLLKFSRVNTGRETESVMVDCNIVIRQLEAVFTSQLNEINGEMHYTPMPSVLANKTQIEQLFQNLISNAIKFKSDRPLKIEIGCFENKTNWQFFVKDNGIGIAPRYFDKIFVIFEKLHQNNKYAGTGIGLAICKKIVELHNGKIWVESIKDFGSIFYFSLPK